MTQLSFTFPVYKRCRACQTWRPEGEFYMNARRLAQGRIKLYRMAVCRGCQQVACRGRYHKHRQQSQSPCYTPTPEASVC